MEGPDHEFALEPDELDQMVSAVRDTELALGSGEKHILNVETELYEKARRGIHAVESIAAGQMFTEENVKILRAGKNELGLHPKFYSDVLGSTATTDINVGKGIEWNDVDH
jgi:N-acetylneuraminate synthase